MPVRGTLLGDDTWTGDDTDEWVERGLNEVLTNARPAGYKMSRNGIYFWPTLEEAQSVTRHFPEQNCIIEVDTSKLDASKLYAADSLVTDSIYELVGTGDAVDDPESQRELDVAERLGELGEQYWDSVEPYNPRKKYPSTHEIIYNNEVPADAIHRVIGCDVKNIGAQQLLTRYTAIGNAQRKARN